MTKRQIFALAALAAAIGLALLLAVINHYHQSRCIKAVDNIVVQVTSYEAQGIWGPTVCHMAYAYPVEGRLYYLWIDEDGSDAQFVVQNNNFFHPPANDETKAAAAAWATQKNLKFTFTVP